MSAPRTALVAARAMAAAAIPSEWGSLFKPNASFFPILLCKAKLLLVQTSPEHSNRSTSQLKLPAIKAEHKRFGERIRSPRAIAVALERGERRKAREASREKVSDVIQGRTLALIRDCWKKIDLPGFPGVV